MASVQPTASARTGEEFAPVFARDTGELPAAAPDALILPEWRREDWQKLFASATVRPFKTSEVVIQRGAIDRALYFVAMGVLEVGVTHFDGVTMSTLARINAGTVIGEQSFFDAQPRSANVWAITEGALLRWEYESYLSFGAEEPRLARDLLFGVARVLSTRLRTTTIRVRR